LTITVQALSARQSFAYVVRIEGSRITLNLRDSHTGQYASHREGISPVVELGSLFAINAGPQFLIARVLGLHFAEPREAHREGVGTTGLNAEPLRHLEAVIQGYLSRRADRLEFTRDNLVSPALGAGAYPLTSTELRTILRTDSANLTDVILGNETRTGLPLRADLQDILPRHVAVIGATGQGKSSFTAAILQQLVALPRPRIVVFDINGEYQDSMVPYLSESEILLTHLGGATPEFKIPYYALGRHGLSRLLLPSERTQRPALNFALESLPFVQWDDHAGGVGLVGSEAVLFDDCRPTGVAEAEAAIASLRRKDSLLPSGAWPPMRALACLVADSHCITPGRNGPERNAFSFQNVAPLITRILRRVDDPQFQAVVDIEGGKSPGSGSLDWVSEGSRLVDSIFGETDSTWKIHILNLREVAHDVLPLVLGSLLELFAFELFRRGQDHTYPTLLVLEEAHHYLRQVASDADEPANALAYERLAKEGRKFGVSLWLSTQRPSEISPTVLGQCGTWATFRLIAEQDLRAIAAVSESVDRHELNRIAGLPRQHLLLFGAGVPIPVRLIAKTANPPPKSQDPDYTRWGLAAPETPRAGEIAEYPVWDPDDDNPF
jgi:hypothetical protein